MGDYLINLLCKESQLPYSLIKKELLKLIERAGADHQSITLDEIRNILADYLQDTLLAAKESADS